MDNVKQAKKLIRRYNATKGMVNEIHMKCQLLKSRIQTERRNGNPVTEELNELVNNSLAQYRSDLSKYKKQMNCIFRQVEDLCR